MNKKDMRGTGSKENVGRKKGIPTKTAAVRLPTELIEEHGINDAWLKDAVQMKIARQLIDSKDVSELLAPALRQLCHNNGEEGFVFAYEVSEAKEILSTARLTHTPESLTLIEEVRNA